jgi:hypothetical protein
MFYCEFWSTSHENKVYFVNCNNIEGDVIIHAALFTWLPRGPPIQFAAGSGTELLQGLSQGL